MLDVLIYDYVIMKRGVFLEIVELLKVLGDETRLRILSLLYDCPCFVRDIFTILELQQSNTSRHLQRLVSSKLIASKQCGQSTCYYIDPKRQEDEMIKMLVKAYQRTQQSLKDQAKLKNHIETNSEMLQKLEQYHMLKEQHYA